MPKTQAAGVRRGSLLHPPFAVGVAAIILLLLSGLQNHYRADVENDASRGAHEIRSGGAAMDTP